MSHKKYGPEEIIINKALGALHHCYHDHEVWFHGLPKGHLDQVFLYRWRKHGELVKAYAETFRELRVRGTYTSAVKRCELPSQQQYPY